MHLFRPICTTVLSTARTSLDRFFSGPGGLSIGNRRSPRNTRGVGSDHLKRIARTVVCLALGWGILTAVSLGQENKTPTFATLEEAASDPDFGIQGEYLTPEGSAQQKGIQVVAQGKGTFRVVIYTGGLPGAGWDRNVPQISEDEETEGVQGLLKTLQAVRTSRTSPTLGAMPPAGAVVLFDGTEESLQNNWLPGAGLTPDGFLAAGATSKEQFRDYSLHAEFRTPYLPTARGQARGNSGIYHQGRYETQVLDSFGLEGLNNETGGIYTVRAPDLNLCLPPLSWQTYDVDFTAPRFDDAGKKLSSARLTVRLNGVVVQRDVEVHAPTRAAPLKETPENGPIFLQNHGNPVAFRNLWVVARDADKEALRPRIPGYERFLSLSNQPLEGGLILMGELGCANCHAVDANLKAELLAKQAPILTNVGQRVSPEWMMNYITNPHETKPGTTMPSLFDGWNAADREAAALAIVNFLTANGKLNHRQPEPRMAAQGEKLFHSIGCVACHAPQNGTAVPEATSVSLTGLVDKYSIQSLTQFLKEPHQVRPSGRMPTFKFQKEEPEQLAHYLMREGAVNLPANVHYKVYHGSWEQLPNFDELTPVAEGECLGFDLSKAGRKDQFGMRFEGYLPRLPSLTVEFGLGSDDGARVVVEGQTVIETDGIHPFSMNRKTARLEGLPGYHVRVDYFELGGEEELVVEVNVAGQPATDLGLMLQLNENQPARPQVDENTKSPSRFRIDPGLIAKGRELFTSIGCANCHEFKQNKETLRSTLVAKNLNELNLKAGCLAEAPASSQERPVPDFDLVPGQRRDLAIATTEATGNLHSSPQDRIHRTLVTFNCYGCHERQGQGGPESARNEFFTSTEHEMGDEGRLPPLLTGVGDKLQDGWLKTVLDKGAENRPYMLTQMPSFGGRNIGHLAEAFIAQDRHEESSPATFEEPAHRVKANGRQLVGNGGLACIKCHNFGDKKATGIQAISLTEMTGRIREDWFLRYLIDPVKYRPGTRMPTGFPNGQAVNRDLYHGDPNMQVTSIWTYLTDGTRAGLPEGLVAQTIELKPTTEPILYRNFFEETSPRGIAVGYPEKAHLIWDANEFCLRQAWHDRFIDASLHWTGRGSGRQRPMGDHIISLEPGIPFAQLASGDTPWTQGSPHQLPGYQFKGYRLNEKGQPTFQYTTPFGTISDFPEPVAVNQHEGTFRRKLTLDLPPQTTDVYFRAAVGKSIEPVEDGFRVNEMYVIRITGGGNPLIRTSADHRELLIPVVPAQQGETELIEEILW